MPRLFFLLCFLCCLSGTNSKAETLFESGPSQTTLLELYSSEGCSSCPPAETWISNLKKSPELWTKIVPVVFHVDYWDYLGWPDPFAASAFTQRQKDYSNSWGKNAVYTPGFIANGKEWRGWFNRERSPAASTVTPGKLKASLKNNQLQVSFEGTSTSSLEVEVALLGTGLQIDVQRGENSGKKLLHDFVVLHLDRHSFNSKSAQIDLPSASLSKATALALWIRNPDTHEILQSAGAWISR